MTLRKSSFEMKTRLREFDRRMPATNFILAVEHDRIVVTYDGTGGGRVTRVVTDKADWQAFLTSKADEAGVPVTQLNVYASSTLDFPDEFTKNEATIAFAKQLRSCE